MIEGESSQDVRYTRPVPAEWEELVALSDSLLDASDHSARTPVMAEALLNRLGELGNEKLETNRYYGMGLVMCGIARALHDQDTRAQTVEHMGTRLFQYWKLAGSTERDSLQPGDISGNASMVAFSGIARSAGEAFPEGVQQLNDALFIEANERQSAWLRRARDVRRTIGDSRQPLDYATFGAEIAEYRPFVRAESTFWTLERGIKRGIAAEAVGRSATAAACDVLRTVLGKRAVFNEARLISAGDDYDEALPFTAVELMDDAGDTMAKDLESIGARCAALRLDETTDLGSYIELDANGRPVFRRDRMVRPADLSAPTVGERGDAVLHTERQRCPAMFVEGLIPDLLQIVSEAVRTADNLAKQQSGGFSQ